MSDSYKSRTATILNTGSTVFVNLTYVLEKKEGDYLTSVSSDLESLCDVLGAKVGLEPKDEKDKICASIGIKGLSVEEIESLLKSAGYETKK